MKEISIIIPAYKAEKTIKRTIESIAVQTIIEKIEIIVSSDDPKGKYGFLRKSFPELDIKILKTKKNVGSGLARQKGLDKATGKWVMFVDADDILASSFSVEALYYDIREDTVGVQGYFEEVVKVDGKYNFIKEMNIDNAWLFSRLYNIDFLREHNIRFSELRAVEDGEFNWKFVFCVNKYHKQIKLIEDVCYYWTQASEESITRIGTKDNIPQYTYDFCRLGYVLATSRYINFITERKADRKDIVYVIAKCFISNYFYYISSRIFRNEFSEQMLWVSQYFYHNFYKAVMNEISPEAFEEMYEFIKENIDIPFTDEEIKKIPFDKWLNLIQTMPYSVYGIDRIREKLDKDVLANDKKYFPEKLSELFIYVNTQCKDNLERFNHFK